ncbi:N-acetyltransferase family protein [Sagittula sp. SSi028]|uniref:GNAT family N-acetyltransferase n=1 Tax=Sagittula sp. SSi028 TaxID=3400636 RepID=UPI003AF90282
MITTLTPEDLNQIVPLLRDLNALHAMHLPDRFHNDGSDAALLELLRAEHAQGARFIMYETEGVARGYLKWRPMPEGPQALCRPQRRALLDHIYVDPIWRRRGLASRLITRFETEIAAEFAGWTVRVHAFNRASRALMDRHGAHAAVLSLDKPLGQPS